MTRPSIPEISSAAWRTCPGSSRSRWWTRYFVVAPSRLSALEDIFLLCEEQGINTAILRLDNDTLRILNGYRNERGGKIQWIAQVKPKETDLRTDIDQAVDNGAVAVYVHGGVGDRFVEQGKVDLLGEALTTDADPPGLARRAGFRTAHGFQEQRREDTGGGAAFHELLPDDEPGVGLEPDRPARRMRRVR